MANSGITDEELMAYADGELDEPRASQIDLALADDPALADRLAQFTDSRDAVSKAFRADLDTPVPNELIAKIRRLDAETRDDPGNASIFVADPDLAARPRNINRKPLWQTGVAASIALAVGLVTGLFLSQPEGTTADGVQIAILNDPAIVEALGTSPSGTEQTINGEDRFAAISTFRDATGSLCREFEYDASSDRTIVSVACHIDNSWNVQFAVAAPATDIDGYAPASSMDALDAYLSATGADLPLSIEAEAEALRALP